MCSQSLSVSSSLSKGEITAGLYFWVSEDHRILNIRDVFNKHCRCLARNLVRIMHFSLHTEEICLHNICQQPEQFCLYGSILKSAALPFSCCWHSSLSLSLSHQAGSMLRERGVGCQRVSTARALRMHDLSGADCPISFLCLCLNMTGLLIFKNSNKQWRKILCLSPRVLLFHSLYNCWAQTEFSSF